MSTCPHLDVSIGGVLIPCLIDTGFMVSTVTETFFVRHFEAQGLDRLRSCQWLQLRAANGLSIPYVGYLELEVDLCGKTLPGCGILVIKDLPGTTGSRVPGVLGMNVLGRCYRELFGQHGPALFEVTSVLHAPPPVKEALQQCHQVEVELPSGQPRRVKVRGGRACRVPAGSMKFVPSTCSAIYSDGIALFEPPESGLPGTG